MTEWQQSKAIFYSVWWKQILCYCLLLYFWRWWEKEEAYSMNAKVQVLDSDHKDSDPSSVIYWICKLGLCTLTSASLNSPCIRLDILLSQVWWELNNNPWKLFAEFLGHVHARTYTYIWRAITFCRVPGAMYTHTRTYQGLDHHKRSRNICPSLQSVHIY